MLPEHKQNVPQALGSNAGDESQVIPTNMLYCSGLGWAALAGGNAMAN